MRRLVLCALALVAAGCSQQTDPVADALHTVPVRNIVIISFDALRADALGLYGYDRGTSPNLDRFAERAVVFERAHSGAQATPTSFAGAFTARYPFRTFRGWKLEDDATLAAHFAANGFHTAFFANNIQVMAERGFGAGFDDYLVRSEGDDPELLPLVLDWIDESPTEPFLAWFHFLSPHTPYDFREEMSQFYDPDYTGSFERTTGGEFNAETPADQKRVRDLYDGEVFYADWIFQQVMDRLEARGVLDDTLIVVTTDHGEEFLDHGQYQHNHVYEEVSRIPFLMGHTAMASQVRTDKPASNVDLLPTLASIAGIPVPEKRMDGVDLSGEVDPARVKVVSAMTHAHDRQIAVYRGTDKLILVCSPEYGEQLYDLAIDPGEKQDRAPDDPPLVEALVAEATEVFGEEPCNGMQKATQGLPIETGLTDEQIERLRSLGYIQ